MKKQKILLTCVSLICIVAILFAFLVYTNNLLTFMHNDIDSRLSENATHNITSFELQMQEQIEKVNTLAEFLSQNWDLDQSVQASLLKAAFNNNEILRCALAYPDGSFITHDNKNEGNVSNDEFFIANTKGEFFITDPRPAVVDATKTVILFAAPILDSNNKFLGSIIYSYLCDDIEKMLTLKSMGGGMNMMVLNKSGEILIGSSQFKIDGMSLRSSLQSKCTHQLHKSNECFDLTKDTGTTVLSIENDDGSAIYVRYDKLKIKDWYLVSSISEQSALVSIAYTAQNQRTLITIIASVIIVFGIICMILWSIYKKTTDVDTKVLTLYAFKHAAKKILAARKNENYVMVQLDVKNFKLINRIYSFEVGDKLIKATATALRNVLSGRKSIVSRIGIDTFVFLLPYEGAAALNEKRMAFMEQFNSLMKHCFTTKVIFPTGQYILKASDYPILDVGELLEKVNFAHKFAKQKWDDIIDYEEDIENSALLEKTIEDRMEKAIRDEEFTLYLQPKVLLKGETLCGAEALVRWKLDDKYYIYPTDFVPILERNGFIVQLDKYMFECVAKYIKSRIDSDLPVFNISVNFSRHHIGNESFVNDICCIADKYGVPRNYFEIELTESAFLGNVADTIALIDKLHYEGFIISMDDFGSGYSSFAQLKDLKIDILKIDKGFFTHNNEGDRLKSVISGIVRIAHDLNITTVAEGIETKEQVEMLLDLGCEIVQGYYYAKPMPASELDILNFKENE